MLLLKYYKKDKLSQSSSSDSSSSSSSCVLELLSYNFEVSFGGAEIVAFGVTVVFSTTVPTIAPSSGFLPKSSLYKSSGLMSKKASLSS